MQCKALYAYGGENEGDLSFEEGDIITVVDQSNPEGWWVTNSINTAFHMFSNDVQRWEGELNGHRGLFPSNFVQLL